MTIAIWVAAGAATAHLVTRMWLLMRCGWVGSDTYYHLIVGGILRKTRRWPLRHDRFIRSEVVDYPPLLPLLAAVWPRRHHRELQYLGPASDFGALLVVGAVSYSLNGWWAAALAMVIYASTPYAFDMGYSLNPRPIANLFMTISLGSLLLIDTVGAAAVVTAGLFGGLVLLSHRLTTQSYLAAIGPFALIAPLGVLTTLVLASLTAVTLSGGVYVSVARGHIAFIRDIRKSHAAGPLGKTIPKILMGNPHALLIVVLAASQFSSTEPKGEVIILAVCLIYALAIAWPFGEGDRHVANASSLVSILVPIGSWAGGSGWLITGTVLAGTTVIVAKLVKYPHLAELGASTVVTAPVRQASAVIYAETGEHSLPLVLTWPQSLSYQMMYFARARGVLASGGTGIGLAYNVALEARIQRDGLLGLTATEVPDYVFCLEHHRLVGLDQGWIPIYRRDGAELYRRVSTDRADVAGRGDTHE